MLPPATIENLPTDVPDDTADAPIPGQPLTYIDGGLSLPALIFGAGAFSNQYNPTYLLASHTPVRVVRLALRYGITAFDTSIYYGPSEIVLGNALQLVKDEFPRSSYKLMTKCGRFGPLAFDYDPATIRSSIKRSLERLQTNYLDAIYLHDVEFVATPVVPRSSGNHSSALSNEKAEYGLLEGDEAVAHGEGDRKILLAIAELQKLKDEGVVRNIGLTGYPLPTLLRLAILALHTTPLKPLDVVLSYAHMSLQNSTFATFIPQFRERARVAQLITASPFNMGLLTPAPPPPWHPATEPLLAAVTQIRNEHGSRLPDVALGIAIRLANAQNVPLATGFSQLNEVHECVKVWREVRDGTDHEKRVKREEAAQRVLEESGFYDWSWASP